MLVLFAAVCVAIVSVMCSEDRNVPAGIVEEQAYVQLPYSELSKRRGYFRYGKRDTVHPGSSSDKSDTLSANTHKRRGYFRFG
jgi:hypothetical protein